MATAMRDRWTDERLDDLNRKVDGIYAEIRVLRGEMNERFSEVNDRLEGIHARFDRMQRTMLIIGAAMFTALAGVVATLLAVVLTQL
jgi:tetrahydromethanopterin S-methyltransferase subunit G